MMAVGGGVGAGVEEDREMLASKPTRQHLGVWRGPFPPYVVECGEGPEQVDGVLSPALGSFCRMETSGDETAATSNITPIPPTLQHTHTHTH